MLDANKSERKQANFQIFMIKVDALKKTEISSTRASCLNYFKNTMLMKTIAPQRAEGLNLKITRATFVCLKFMQLSTMICSFIWSVLSNSDTISLI